MATERRKKTDDLDLFAPADPTTRRRRVAAPAAAGLGGPSGPAMSGGPSGPAMSGGPSGPAMRGAAPAAPATGKRRKRNAEDVQKLM